MYSFGTKTAELAALPLKAERECTSSLIGVDGMNFGDGGVDGKRDNDFVEIFFFCFFLL